MRTSPLSSPVPTYRPAEALAAKDVPNAGAHVLDAGHFALDTKVGGNSVLLREYMKAQK
jgi:hypothetical protein